MTEPTEHVTDGALPNSADEWIPRELIESKPGALFRRLAPPSTDESQPLPAPAPTRRFEPSQPPITPLISQRLDEVERRIAEARRIIEGYRPA